MAKQAIIDYYNKLDKSMRYGGTQNESVIRKAFSNLLDHYCESKNLELIEEVPFQDTGKRPDGTVRDASRLDWGYWESKDPHDNLDEEIAKKFALGYPSENILFENSQEIVLIQQGEEQLRGNMQDADFLHQILTMFVEYERPEIAEFNKAVEQFKQDIPHIVTKLRETIAAQNRTNSQFQRARNEFWELCKESINPDISAFDIQEMLIQHILTEEIFNTVFDETYFHRENNIARELERVILTFFNGKLRRDTLHHLDVYYQTIKARAAAISDHHHKQEFLKTVYENFYKAYNPKGADKLGVVYTPNEIVHFMIESTNYLLEKHFGKQLHDQHVEILDPATGTGTFVTELIEHIPQQYLTHKYKHEIHCNELAILPYYIANLNIEYTYQQKMGQYEPFENIVFVDTLDNLGFEYVGKQYTMFSLAAENLARIKKQNDKKISVIIGNPPYNAKQPNYNDFNPNKAYAKIDERIKKSYVKYGHAQNQIVLYDMFTRFYRWAMDRIDENGVVAFITNRSFIDSRAFDGFRQVIADDFAYIYIVDTQSDVRKNPKIAGTTHNVFGIQTGVAIMFLVKTPVSNSAKAQINYFSLPDEMRKRQKLEWLNEHPLKTIPFESIQPDAKHNWIDLTDNDFDTLLSLMDKEVKAGKAQEAVFQLFSRGIVTQRDEWVYDFSREHLEEKVRYFVDVYQHTLADANYPLRNSIKWDAELTSYIRRHIEKEYDNKQIVCSLYRPFVKKYFYFDKHFNGRTYQWPSIYQQEQKNVYILVKSFGSNRPFNVMATDTIAELHVSGANQALPFYTYDTDGKRQVNISDWALKQFQAYYGCQPPLAPPSQGGEQDKINNMLPNSSPLQEGKLENPNKLSASSPLQDKEQEKNADKQSNSSPLQGEAGRGFPQNNPKSTDHSFTSEEMVENENQPPLTPPSKGGEQEENISELSIINANPFKREGKEQKKNTCKPSTSSPLQGEAGRGFSITKESIFYYIYAVLHNPAYRQHYELNLKREFPRIPFYRNFEQWTAWGKTLMELHINYDQIEPYPLHRCENEPKLDRPQPKLKAIPETGEIVLDENTTLSGIPTLAWEYKLGNRSAIHWILDQYKEKKPRDKTIADQFHHYRFADYKEQVIDLICRVTTVSIETMKMVQMMAHEESHES